MNYENDQLAFSAGYDKGYGFGCQALAWSTASKPETFPEDKGQRVSFLEGYEAGCDYRLDEQNSGAKL